MQNAPQDIAQNIAQVRAQIAQCCAQTGRDRSAVMLLAVSKTVNETRLLSAVAAGQWAFGENYVQEGVEKICAMRELLPPAQAAQLQWHLIGPVQSNKTKQVAAHFDWVHTVDRLKIAERLSAQRPAHLPPLQVLLQVNVDGAPTKAGVPAQDLLPLALAVQALPRLHLRGLMSMPDVQATQTATQVLHQRAAQALVQLRAQLQAHAQTPAQGKLQAQAGTGLPMLDVLSMGMSADLCAAISAGSTLVRVGSAIFGARS